MKFPANPHGAIPVSRTNPNMPAWPTTPEGWCAWFRALDHKYGTVPAQIPLGHDYRCPIHGTKEHA